MMVWYGPGMRIRVAENTRRTSGENRGNIFNQYGRKSWRIDCFPVWWMMIVGRYHRSGGDQHQTHRFFRSHSEGNRRPCTPPSASLPATSGTCISWRAHCAAASQGNSPLSPAPHNVAAFNTLLAELATRPRPLILDSFCGTGHSTATLARHYPGHLVVGIDKSRHRLGRHPTTSPPTPCCYRPSEDFWRLLVAAGWAWSSTTRSIPAPGRQNTCSAGSTGGPVLVSPARCGNLRAPTTAQPGIRPDRAAQQLANLWRSSAWRCTWRDSRYRCPITLISPDPV